MNPKYAKLLIPVIAVAGAAAAGYLFQQGGAVVETAPVRQVVTHATGAAPAAAPNVGQLAYLAPLAEPDDTPTARPLPKEEAKRAPASMVTKGPAPVEAPATLKDEAKATPKAATGGDCQQGARAMGDCNCYDEAAGKVTLTLHPTKACIDEESKRLGHKLVMSNGDGSYTLAGLEPEPAPVPADAAMAAPQLTPAEQAWQARHPNVRIHGRKHVIFGSFNQALQGAVPANPLLNLQSAAPPVPLLDLQGRPRAQPLVQYYDSRGQPLRTHPGVSFAEANLLKKGICPAGSKNEGCRCIVFNRETKTETIVPAADQPNYCSDSRIRDTMNQPHNSGSYFNAWFDVVGDVLEQQAKK